MNIDDFRFRFVFQFVKFYTCFWFVFIFILTANDQGFSSSIASPLEEPERELHKRQKEVELEKEFDQVDANLLEKSYHNS